jgi:hypothetical protein
VKARLALVLTLFAGALSAGPVLTISTRNVAADLGYLAKVDVNDGSIVWHAYLHLAGESTKLLLTDIAYSPGGDLYGIDGASLYSIAMTGNDTGGTSDAAATKIGDLNVSNGWGNSLVFASDYTLFMAGEAYNKGLSYANMLYTISLANGQASATTTNLGDDPNKHSAGDLAFYQGALYLTTLGTTTGGVTTGAVMTRITGSGVDSGFSYSLPNGSFYGLATSGSLYGVSGQTIYVMDPEHGSMTPIKSYDGTLIGDTSGTSFFGEADATPEPATLGMVGGALALAGILGKRKRARA